MTRRALNVGIYDVLLSLFTETSTVNKNMKPLNVPEILSNENNESVEEVKICFFIIF